jgi:hypothetical protein
VQADIKTIKASRFNQPIVFHPEFVFEPASYQFLFFLFSSKMIKMKNLLIVFAFVSLSATAQNKSLFNGKDLTGWKIYGTEKWVC